VYYNATGSMVVFLPGVENVFIMCSLWQQVGPVVTLVTLPPLFHVLSPLSPHFSPNSWSILVGRRATFFWWCH